MKEETPQELVSKHLALLISNLQALKEHTPCSYEQLDTQRLMADAAVCVALEVVCYHELLPSEVQSAVKQLIELRNTIWGRKTVTGTNEQQ